MLSLRSILSPSRRSVYSSNDSFKRDKMLRKLSMTAGFGCQQIKTYLAFAFVKMLFGSSMCAPRVPSTTCVTLRSPATLHSM